MDWDTSILLAYRMLDDLGKVEFIDNITSMPAGDISGKAMQVINQSVNQIAPEIERNQNVLAVNYEFFDKRSDSSVALVVILDGVYLYMRCAKLVPVKVFVRNLLEKGHIVCRVPARKPKSVSERYYRVYERLNPLHEVIPICYN